MLKHTRIGFLLVILLFSFCKRETQQGNYAQPTPFTFSNPRGFPAPQPEPPDNLTTNEGVALGRILFFEKSLSIDGSIACASCHNPKLGFADSAKLSLGVQGRVGNRQSMALSNLRWQKRFFWDGRDTTLEAQVIHPLTQINEMASNEALLKENLSKYKKQFGAAFQSEEISLPKVAKALAQYLRTLISANSNYDKFLRDEYVPTDAERRGLNLFFTHPSPPSLRGGNCGDCHTQILTSGSLIGFDGFRNNGVQGGRIEDVGLAAITGDTTHRGRFKVPSLRNVALSAPYMHDGSLKTLEEVLDHYNDPPLFMSQNIDPLIQNGSNQRNGHSLMLTSQEKTDIIAFLHMLTDSSFAKTPGL